MLNDRWIY